MTTGVAGMKQSVRLLFNNCHCESPSSGWIGLLLLLSETRQPQQPNPNQNVKCMWSAIHWRLRDWNYAEKNTLFLPPPPHFQPKSWRSKHWLVAVFLTPHPHPPRFLLADIFIAMYMCCLVCDFISGFYIEKFASSDLKELNLDF